MVGSVQETTRVPLIIADPRHPQHHGQHYRKPVEIVNLVETIYELVGVDHVCVLCVYYLHNYLNLKKIIPIYVYIV